jgi:hypothetical protein
MHQCTNSAIRDSGGNSALHLRTVPASPESNIEAARIRRASEVLAGADPAWQTARDLATLTASR